MKPLPVKEPVLENLLLRLHQTHCKGCIWFLPIDRLNGIDLDHQCGHPMAEQADDYTVPSAWPVVIQDGAMQEGLTLHTIYDPQGTTLHLTCEWFVPSK